MTRMRNVKEDIKVFPYALMRIAGESFETLELLNMKDSFDKVQSMNFLEKEADELKLKICDELYSIIPGLPDSGSQNLFVRIKRNIFNKREISVSDIDALRKFGDPALYEKILNLNLLKEKQAKLKGEYKTIFADELKQKRICFQKILSNENFMNGLVISSRTLVDRTLSYSAKNVDTFGKDDFRAELSLIKYVSRMCAKTSPFSTFTNMVLCDVGKLEKNETALFKESGISKRNIISHVRLNGSLFLYLKGLLYKNIKISRWFRLRPNPTLKTEEKEYVFLTNFDNIESFQRLAINPVVDVIIHLTKQEKGGILFNELTNIIIENEYIDAPKEDLENFVTTLIDYGLLEYNIGVSGIDPDWDIKLVEKLKVVEKQYGLAGDLAHALCNIRNMGQRYASGSVKERIDILNTAHSCFKDICMKLHEDAGLPEEERLENPPKPPAKPDENKKEQEKEESSENPENEEFKTNFKTKFSFRPQQIFYEDTSLDCEFKIDKDKITGILSKINALLSSLRIHEINREEMIKMKHFFRQTYGEDAKIPVLSFYEEFYRDFKKPEADRQEELRKKTKENQDEQGKALLGKTEDENLENIIPPIVKYRKILENWKNSLKKNFIESAQNNIEKINFCKDILPVVEELENEKFDTSREVFVQLFRDNENGKDNNLKFVLNVSAPGFGKFFSRFLHLFDYAVTEEIINDNVSHSQNNLFIEDCDYSHFNANIHPPLMPFEIWLPGSQNGLSPEQQISITEIEVQYDKSADMLKLKHTGMNKEIYVFDLGFQSILMRSKLFQLLQIFTKAEYIYPSYANNILNEYRMIQSGIESIENLKSIFIRPRIEFENSVVLQRKSWLIPQKLIPYKNNNENLNDYFFRVNTWRIENKIPEEVFAFVSLPGYQGAQQKIPEKKKLKLVSDDHKPQYINFRNPFLINLFAKLCDKVNSIMRIDEMLPSSKDILIFGGKKYVTEFILQWSPEKNHKNENNHGK